MKMSQLLSAWEGLPPDVGARHIQPTAAPPLEALATITPRYRWFSLSSYADADSDADTDASAHADGQVQERFWPVPPAFAVEPGAADPSPAPGEDKENDK